MNGIAIRITFLNVGARETRSRALLHPKEIASQKAFPKVSENTNKVSAPQGDIEHMSDYIEAANIPVVIATISAYRAA
jgi:hypothetical protein